MSKDFKGFDPPDELASRRAKQESIGDGPGVTQEMLGVVVDPSKLTATERRILEESGPPPGKIIRVDPADDAPFRLPPPPTPQQRAANFVAQNGWFVIVFPDSDMHWALAEKLAKAKPGEMIPLSNNEMALLTEFMPWPKPPHSASF